VGKHGRVGTDTLLPESSSVRPPGGGHGVVRDAQADVSRRGGSFEGGVYGPGVTSGFWGGQRAGQDRVCWGGGQWGPRTGPSKKEAGLV